jgi:hypothetical protein
MEVRKRGNRECPCGAGCRFGTDAYKTHLQAHQRRQKTLWQRRKREEERINQALARGGVERDGVIITQSDPGFMGLGKPVKGERRVCYCGCGAVAGTPQYDRHYQRRYERVRRLRAAKQQPVVQRKAGRVPLFIAWSE